MLSYEVELCDFVFYLKKMLLDGTYKIGQAMRKKYKREMDYVYAIMNDLERKLERPIRDLDDVRTVMETLKKIREQEVDMELKIDPVEVSNLSQCRIF